jgi:hypothetical protein
VASGVADAIWISASLAQHEVFFLLTPRSPIRLLVFDGTKPLIGFVQEDSPFGIFRKFGKNGFSSGITHNCNKVFFKKLEIN